MMQKKRLVADALTLKSSKDVERILLLRSNDNKNALIECELI